MAGLFQRIGDRYPDVAVQLKTDTLTAALTENGVLVDYLLILKELTTQVERIHTFLITQVCLLEEHRKDCKVAKEMPTVKFMSIVSGKTLDSEKTLLDRVRFMGNITLVEDSSDPQLIVVFCPITSRIESDLESVMAKRPASLCDKPVLLVMMYHMHEPKAGVIQKPGSVLKRWNIVLDVNVFYHETVYGLVPCAMNTQAISAAVVEVQEAVLQQEPRLVKAMIPAPTLHITLLVTHLANQEQVGLAVTALAKAMPSLADLLDGRDLVLPFSGVGHFRKEVVFIGMTPGQHRDTLEKLAEVLQRCFEEQGLLQGDCRGFKPHLTIMKLSKAPKLRSQ
ncbi:hypothetical protein NHX12_026702, partial [Muraenolepis orangiensis]